MKLTSPDFTEDGTIAVRNAGRRSPSPRLEWSDVAVGTRAFALAVEDPDAPGGTFVHWLLWNLPARARALPEGILAARHLEAGAKQGTNDYGSVGWGGPEPPPGAQHRYVFSLFALVEPLPLAAGAGSSAFFDAVRPRALGVATLVGRFGA